MLYAELGRYPLDIVIKTRTIGFWNRIIVGKDTKISYLLYHVLRILDNPCFKWISNVRNILAHSGRNDIWVNQSNAEIFPVKYVIKRNLLDQFLQKWQSNLNNSTKGMNYSIFKDSVEFEKYFILLPKHLYLNMVRFRTGNHKLPVETGRWNDVDYKDRKCNLCENESVGDEFHYVLECPFFVRERQRLIPTAFYSRPNILKYHNLLSTKNEMVLTSLSKFMGIIMRYFA